MWYGLFAPAKTPTSVVAALNQEISQIVNSTEIKSKITSQGYQIVTGSPEEFALLVRKDLERYRKVILEAKMQQDL
jgi:tripartite-type tricarboxylate transporter receptor subunit TctC